MSTQEYYEQYPRRQESSGKALAALILGICGLVVVPVLCSVLAIVFAIQARAEIEESGGRLGGAGNAQAGLILGWIGLAISAVGLLLVLVVLAGMSSAGGFS